MFELEINSERTKINSLITGTFQSVISVDHKTNNAKSGNLLTSDTVV